MIDQLEKSGGDIAKSAYPVERIRYGPWQGSIESMPADMIPREYAAGTTSSNFLFLPRYGRWKRRGGQTIQFDTLPSASGVGLLPAKWGGKARQMEEFVSSSLASDGIPTLATLVTKETLADTANVDDGRFSNLWVRDQVSSANYTLGSEYSLTTTYPAVGTTQTYRVVPLWYDSADLGGLTRGAGEFPRRFFLSGSRRFAKVGNWWYFPNVYGTPCRWNGERAQASAALGSGLQATSTITVGGWTNNTGVPDSGTLHTHLDEETPDDDSTFIRGMVADSFDGCVLGVPAVSTANSTYTVRIKWKYDDANVVNAFVWFRISLNRSDGSTASSDKIYLENYSVSTYYTSSFTVTGFLGSGVATDRIGFAQGSDFGTVTPRVIITWFDILAGSASTNTAEIANRLIPSGPLPPTHAGTLAKGTATTEGVTSTLLPDADVADGLWVRSDNATATNNFQMVDENPPVDTDYVYQSASSDGTAAEMSLSNPSASPDADSTVTLFVRVRKTGGVFTTPDFSFSLYDGSTLIATRDIVPISNSAFTTYELVLTAAQVEAVTNWSDIRVKFNTAGALADQIHVSHVRVEISTPPESDAVWRGRDRFLYSVAYRFEDGSIWAPCTPRVTNTTLTSGYNLFTVDSNLPDQVYDKVAWSNIPIGPHGVVGRILLRTPKINSTDSGGQELNPFDLRVITEIQDNTTTTYDDYLAGDAALQPDHAGLFIRFDHIMPPRARYLFAGDMRVCHAYGGNNPCAIIIAPVGRAADYDLNSPDTASIYGSQGSWMRVDGVDNRLTLVQGDGASATNTKQFAFSTYTTLQALVDAINATNFATDGQQWRAQLCPGVNPQAPTSALVRHYRTATVTTSTSTSVAIASGARNFAVGQRITKADIPAGAYITEIVSDTEFTISAAATGGASASATFFFDLGDVAITDDSTYQRVISNSLPGFLYFSKDYLDDQTFDKSSVWMTVATPGTYRSAANSFSGKFSNRFKPPIDAGISMGGGGVDQGFVVPFANAIYAIRNVVNEGSGIDEDYRIVPINQSRGCCAWNTVLPGNRFVPYLTPEGFAAADLMEERFFSEALHSHAPLFGAFDYEIPLCVSATARDTDAAYASARIMRSQLWVSFRGSGSLPNEQRMYDFSSASMTAGLGALIRPDGQPWGWSTPISSALSGDRAFTAMVEARRDDGAHLYGWADTNGGSTGDGRVDEFETSGTDNGTAIAAEVVMPWEKFDRDMISGQDVTVDHATPTSATTFLDFHRGYADDEYPLTFTGSSTPVVLSDFKDLPQAARGMTKACYLSFRQTTGSAAELRSIELRAKRGPRYQ